MAFNPDGTSLRIGDFHTVQGSAEAQQYVAECLRLSTPNDARLRSAFEAAVEIVLRRSPTSFEPGSGTQYHVPLSIHNQAVILCCGYIYDRPDSPGTNAWANVWLNSGAASLVGHFTSHRAGRI